jgi:hypothetical protein
MSRKYRVSFSFVPLKAEFHYSCIAENKEEAGKKARREIEKALNQIREAIRPFQTDERLLIAADILAAEYSEGGPPFGEKLTGTIYPR